MKLADIDPRELARSTVREALDRVHRVLFELAPLADYRIVDGGGKPIDPENIAGSNVGEAVLALTRYAQTGAPLDAPVQEYCITLIPIAPDALDDSGSPDPSTPLGLVVSAAIAREDLSQGRGISTTRLAALGGVSDSRVRQLVVAGDLNVDKAHDVRPKDAVRWLAARGVPDFR